MKYRLIALSLAMLGATVFVPSAQGQRRSASAPASRPRTAVMRRSGVKTRPVPLRGVRQFSSGSAFAPYFYSDYGDDYEPESVEPPPPQIVEQTAQQASPAPLPNRAGALVLELQDDHWVRIINSGQSQTGGQSSQPQPESVGNPATAIPRRAQAEGLPSELPPAVLVFRDGRKEEIGKYIIIGTTIYTGTDSWSSSSWTRKVQIAELNVPATLELNEERGTKFSLPSGPNEVMIRQ
jgi:hypothetical protein